MTDPTGRYSITYNGEIYNFADLRRELEGEGHSFRGHSDTEVVLAAYTQWGVRAFDRFEGMFALGLWDALAQEMVLARDRFGEKPLYFTELGGTLLFASEMTALLEDPSVARRARPSIAGINHYLALGYILSPFTSIEGIEKLEPATFLRYRNGRVQERSRYWDYRVGFEHPTPESARDIAAHLAHLLDQAVASRLVSDVPVGAFLSGGIDSSGVVALARRHVDYELHTFSVGFSQSSYDESSDARRMATFVGTIHHERKISQHEGASLVEQAVRCYDDLFSDTSLVPMVEVARLASESVKVVLSGDGADEIFAGYPTYLADSLKRRADRLPAVARRGAARLLRPFAGILRGQRVGLGFKLEQFAKGLPEDERKGHYSWRELHQEHERISLIGPQHTEEIKATDPFRIFARHYDDVRDLDPLSRHLYVDAKTWLCDDILVKVDRAAMAWSLESRTPFLHRELVTYAASIPADLKIHGRQQKYILKQALAPLLPPATLRKKKAGFNAPINAWMGHSRENEFRFFNRYVQDVQQRSILHPDEKPAEKKIVSSETMSSAIRTAHNYHDWVFDSFASHLHGGVALEVGSGHGEFARRMLARVDSLVISDIDPAAVEAIRGVIGDDPRVRYLVMNGVEPEKLGRKVDYIVLLNVLEHIRDDGGFVRQCREALTPSGKLIVFAPAFQLLFSRMDREAGHFRRYGREELRQLLLQGGFSLDELRYVNTVGFFGWLVNKWTDSSVNSSSTNAQVRLYDSLIPAFRRVDRVIPHLGQSLLAVASRSPDASAGSPL